MVSEGRPRWATTPEHGFPHLGSAMSTSEARFAANRLNALKSTGPRSEEGKAQSRQNALRHGLTAKQLVLPTEDAAAFEDRRQEWLEAFQPEGPAQKLLLDRAVQASWRLDRCSIAETARLSERVLHAADDFERAAQGSREMNSAEDCSTNPLDQVNSSSRTKSSGIASTSAPPISRRSWCAP